MNAVADHTNEMKAWLDASGWEPGKLTDIFTLPPRGMSKSAFRDFCLGRPSPALTTTSTTPAGNSFDFMIVDELAGVSYERGGLWNGVIPTEKVGNRWLIGNDIIASFKDPNWPDCDTFVALEKLDKRDPRHPNPQAGTQRHWFVLHGEKRHQVKNRTTAELHAKRLHERLVAAKLAEKKEQERQHQLAAERAVEEARRNHEHLIALPTFGGF